MVYSEYISTFVRIKPPKRVVNTLTFILQSANIQQKFKYTMARKKKIIQVPTENVEKLAKLMRCTRSAVYNALAFRSDSDSAKAIRFQALHSYGGIETYKYIM